MPVIKLFYPKFWQTKNLFAYLLWPLSVLYWLLGAARKGIAAKIILPAPVICVGNLSAGGTGKTQMVIWLAKIFRQQNIDFVIVTKAYNSCLRKTVLVNKHHNYLAVGDESIMLAEYGPVIAAKNIQHIQDLVKTLQPAVIIVDDGMQNPNFHKDLIILSIDHQRGLGNEFLIPAGPLRQHPAQAFKLASIVLVIRAQAPCDQDLNAYQQYHKPVFQAEIIPERTASLIDRSKNYFAFTGIGHPERFFSSLKSSGLHILGWQDYPDHHHYSTSDLYYLQLQAEKYQAKLITTRKDYVKIKHRLQAECFDVQLSIDKPQELMAIIYEKIFKKA